VTEPVSGQGTGQGTGQVARVWYVSYGSNMAARRFACYLEGGRPEGGTRVNPGARDRRPPERDIPVDLTGTVYFAGESPQWGGGVAFYDPAVPGRTAARAYLVTAGQLVDVLAQEMYREPADGDPLEELVGGPLPDGRHVFGDGRYESIVEVGRVAGMPLLTFTSPHGSEHVERTPPAASYLAMMAEGLRESRGWSEDQVTAYLDSISGADSGH
jgi:hypothetical protein